MSPTRGASPRILHDAPEGPEAILPGNLLSFVIGAAGVRDADLVNPTMQARDLRHHLGLEPKAVLLTLFN